jgi:hypothetical protein
VCKENKKASKEKEEVKCPVNLKGLPEVIVSFV